MSGETDASQSSWTSDLLMLHMQRQLDDLRILLDERRDDLRILLDERRDDMRTLLDERKGAQEEAIRVQTASLEKEFHEHLVQYRHEVTLAFEASDKAIQKAETATEKRFDSVNEFRAQLADQAANFMPRELAETQFAEADKKIAALTNQLGSITAVQLAAQRNLVIWLTVAGLFISIVVVVANYAFGR